MPSAHHHLCCCCSYSITSDQHHRQASLSRDDEHHARCQHVLSHAPCCCHHHCAHHHHHCQHTAHRTGSGDRWLTPRAHSPLRSVSPSARQRQLSPWVSPPREHQSRYEAYSKPRQRDPWHVEPLIFSPPPIAPTASSHHTTSSSHPSNSLLAPLPNPHNRTAPPVQSHPLFPNRTGPPLHFGRPRTFPKKPSHFSPHRSSRSSRRPVPLSFSPPPPFHTPSPTPSHSSPIAHRPSMGTSTPAHRRRLIATRRISCSATSTSSTCAPIPSSSPASQPLQSAASSAQPPVQQPQHSSPILTPEMIRNWWRYSTPLLRQSVSMDADTPQQPSQHQAASSPPQGRSLVQQLQALHIRLVQPSQQATAQVAFPQPDQRQAPDHPHVRMCPPSPPQPPLPSQQPTSLGDSASREGFWWNPTSRRETRRHAVSSAPAQQARLEPAEPLRLPPRQHPQAPRRSPQPAQHAPPSPATPSRPANLSPARARTPTAPTLQRRSMYDPTPLVQSCPPSALACWFCRQNHYSSSCANVPRISDRIRIHMRNARCFRCGGDHLDRECRQPNKKCLACGLDNHHIAFCAHNRQATRDLTNERWLRLMRTARDGARIARHLMEENNTWLRTEFDRLEQEFYVP